MRTLGLIFTAEVNSCAINEICAEAAAATQTGAEARDAGTKDANHTARKNPREGLVVMVSLFFHEPCIALRAGA